MAREGGCRLWGRLGCENRDAASWGKRVIVLTCSWATDGRPCSRPSIFLWVWGHHSGDVFLSTRLPHPPSAMGTLDGNSRPFPLGCCRPSPWSGSVQPFFQGLSDSAICRLLSSCWTAAGPLQPSMNPTPQQLPHLLPPQASSPRRQVQDRTAMVYNFNSLNPPNLPASSPPWDQGTVKYPSPPYSQ